MGVAKAIPAAAAAFLLLALAGPPAARGEEFRDAEPAEFREALEAGKGKPGVVLLDVRTPAEFAEERIEGAENLDFRSPGFRAGLEKIDRGATIRIYCRTGNRSGKALPLLRELGFRDVLHLAKGIVGWKEAGFPTLRGR
jgi:rhodanese-related sulfurtransferase